MPCRKRVTQVRLESKFSRRNFVKNLWKKSSREPSKPPSLNSAARPTPPVSPTSSGSPRLSPPRIDLREKSRTRESLRRLGSKALWRTKPCRKISASSQGSPPPTGRSSAPRNSADRAAHHRLRPHRRDNRSSNAGKVPRLFARPLCSLSGAAALIAVAQPDSEQDRKTTRLNSSHRCISYAVFCLKKKHSQGLHLGRRRRHQPAAAPEGQVLRLPPGPGGGAPGGLERAQRVPPDEGQRVRPGEHIQ